MKHILLVAVLLASGSAFARGSDYDFSCKVSGTAGNGAKVSYWGRTYQGPEFRARTFTLRECRASGLSNCRINYCRGNN